jgi:plastocyanin
MRLTVVAVAATVLLGAVACSDDGDDEDAVTDTTEESADSSSTTAGGSEDSNDDSGGTTTTVPGDGVTDLVIRDYAFHPSVDLISVGDTLTWTNSDAFQHTTTADDGLWDSTPIDPEGTFEFTFEEAGTFTYHCDIHNFMTGTIEVTG